MIANPKKRCSECKAWANYVKDEVFYCIEHEAKDSIALNNVCTICFAVYSDCGICDSCKKFDGSLEAVVAFSGLDGFGLAKPTGAHPPGFDLREFFRNIVFGRPGPSGRQLPRLAARSHLP